MIELLVVVGIIGILAAVAIPTYQNYKNEAKTSTLKGSLNTIAKSYNTCIALKASGDCDTLAKIGISIPDLTTTPTAAKGSGNICFAVTMNNADSGESHVGCVQLSETGAAAPAFTFDDGSDNGTCTTGTCA